jgi:hypothetical protein
VTPIFCGAESVSQVDKMRLPSHVAADFADLLRPTACIISTEWEVLQTMM